MAKIQYIGKKPSKDDNVAGTGIVWNGPGDVQEVKSAEAVEKLLEHKTVWALVPESTPVAEPSEAKAPAPKKGIYEDSEVQPPPVVDFNRMGKDKIQDYCRVHLGTKIDQRNTLADIRAKAWADYGKHMAGVVTANLRK